MYISTYICWTSSCATVIDGRDKMVIRHGSEKSTELRRGDRQPYNCASVVRVEQRYGTELGDHILSWLGGAFWSGAGWWFREGECHLNWVLKAEKFSKKLTRQGECISSAVGACEVTWGIQATLSYSPLLEHERFWWWSWWWWGGTWRSERSRRLEWEN